MQESCTVAPQESTIASRIANIHNLAIDLEQSCDYVDRTLLGDTPEPPRSNQKDPECIADVLDSIISLLSTAMDHASRTANSLN